MSCEFLSDLTNGKAVACKTVVALSEIRGELDGAFTVIELRQELCLNPSCEAQEQCKAYLNLKKYGKASQYAK